MKVLLTNLLIAFFATISLFAQAETGIFTLQYNDDQSNTHYFSMDVPEDYDPNQAYPALVSIHGNGMPSTDMVQWFNPNAVTAEAINICPDENNYWDGSTTMSAMQWAMQEYNLGEFYATGFSMGGALAIQLEIVMPDFFTGAILVNPAVSDTELPASVADTTAEKLNIGIIIGTEDPNYASIISLANDIETKGGRIKVIEKQGLGHVDQDYLPSQEFYDDWKELFDYINGTSTVEEYFEEDEIIISDNALCFSGKGNSAAKIFSIEGIAVKEVDAGGKITMNLSDLSSGIYIALIENEGRIVRKKFNVVK